MQGGVSLFVSVARVRESARDPSTSTAEVERNYLKRLPVAAFWQMGLFHWPAKGHRMGRP